MNESNVQPTGTSILEKAYKVYLEQVSRREKVRVPHKTKVKKARRAKNKVARKSRAKNR
jgi:hypothetical protein